MSAAPGYFRSEWEAHLAAARALEPLLPTVAEAAQWIADALAGGGKLFFFGNGGSAADAQHLAAEFVVRYRKERPALPALALTTDTSALTAGGNDYGFEQIFARQIAALARPGDVAIGISTSGTSRNVLNGLAAARERGCRTIGLTGRDGGRLPALCDLAVIVPADDTPRIQEMHIWIGHAWCGWVEG